MYIHVQWNLYIVDTIGNHLTALIGRGVLNSGGIITIIGTKASVHIREVSTVRGSTVHATKINENYSDC